MTIMSKFLSSHLRKPGGDFSHTSMKSGSYLILDEYTEDFFKSYLNAIKKGEKLYLTEKHLPRASPIVIDFDFKFKAKQKKRQINKKVIKKIVDHLTNILKEMFGNKKKDLYECFVLQRPEQYLKVYNENKYWTDGIHIQFPNLVCTYLCQRSLREKFLETFKFDFECENKLVDIYDKSVIESNNWCMYLSTKPQNKRYVEADIKPYELKYIFNSENKIDDYTDLELLKLLSIRYDVPPVVNPINNSIIHEHIELIIKEKQTINIKPLDIIANQAYDEICIKKLLNMLKPDRTKEYPEWIPIILILHHCSITDKNKQIDYKLIAHEWSKQCPDKYDEFELNKLWAYLSIKTSDTHLTLGTLHHYAKIDNRDEYVKFKMTTHLQNSFQNKNLAIKNVNKEKDKCLIELDDDYCPFSKNKHDTKCQFIIASKDMLTLRCTKCEKKLKVPLSDKALINTFGIETFPKIKSISDIKHTDEIFLMREEKYKDIIMPEELKYISKDSINKLLKHDSCIIASPTGSGKTTALNKIQENAPPGTNWLSIVSRRSMISVHKKALSIKKLIKNGSKSSKKPRYKEIPMTSYLDKNQDRSHFIVSLEQLHTIDREYDILFLDEFTSLIYHFYSPTMKQFLLLNFLKLIDLMLKCKKVVACDANILDMSLDFFMRFRGDKDPIYYKNTYQNKKNIPMNVYFRTNNPINKELRLFCNKIKDKVINNESVLIFSDSKTIADNIYNHLLKFNANKDYYRLYNRDCGSLKEIDNCNNEWLNKCCIASPKIVYGVDVLIDYKDNVFSIYKGNSIDSLSMHQQVSRARKCSSVSVLFLQKHYSTSSNKFISYDKNKLIENGELIRYRDQMNNKHGVENLNKAKEKVVFTLLGTSECIENREYILQINENSVFGAIHAFSSWYTRLFNYNKSELFLKLCEQQGYIIERKTLEDDNCEVIFEDVSKKLDLEKIKQCEKILNKNIETNPNDIIDIKKRADSIKEALESRMKVIKVTEKDVNQDELLKYIITDNGKFNRCFKSIPLYYVKEWVNKKEINEYVKNFSFIQKSKKLYVTLEIIELLENLLNVNRFNIMNLKVENISRMRKQLMSEINKLQWLSCKSSYRERTIDLKKKIQKLKSEDRIKEFFVKIINKFDDFYSYERKRIGPKKTLTYINFKFNKDRLIEHALIINYLRINQDKFKEPIKNLINNQMPSKIELDTNFEFDTDE